MRLKTIYVTVIVILLVVISLYLAKLNNKNISLSKYKAIKTTNQIIKDIRYKIESTRLKITKHVFATETKHPSITDDTLIGTWEAISNIDVRVYVLKIKRERKSFLAIAGPYGHNRVYQLTRKRVKDGKVFLEFKDLEKNSEIIHIIGEGVAGRDGEREEGGIIAKLIMNPNEKPLNMWKLTFMKGWYIEDLSEICKLAKNAIKKYER